MSNFLAIATVTATLRQLLQTRISADVPGVKVKTVRPILSSDTETSPEIDIFLYQVTPNLGYSNNDLPTRDVNGNLLSRPLVALNLYYLISCIGDDTQLIPQRLLGSLVRTMVETPVLPRQMIIDTINNPAFNYLEMSNLADQFEAIKFTPLDYSLDELSKVWSILYEIPYVLTVGYLATVVLIDGEKEPVPAPVVQQRRLYTETLADPLLEPAAGIKITKTPEGLTQVLITKAVNEAHIDYYALYFGVSSFDKSHIITTLMKTGSDLVYTLPSDIIIPLGANYIVVFTGNTRGEMNNGVAASLNIQSPPNFPANGIDFSDMDFKKGLISGALNILRAVDETNITQYALYWGKDETTQLGEPITVLPRTGLNLIYYFPTDTPVPSDAHYFLVYTQNSYGEMATGISAYIDDKFVPVNPPAGIKFTNMSSVAGEIAGPVTILKAEPDEDNITNYVLYWGQTATQKLSDVDAIAMLGVTGLNVIYTFPPATLIPDGAQYLLAFSRNQYGEMAQGVSVSINNE